VTAPLTEQERRLLQRFRSRQTATLVIAGILVLVGALYGLWATVEFRTPPEQRKPAFDRPIAKLGELTLPLQERLRRVTPRTPPEAAFLSALLTQLDLTSRLLVVLIRILAAITFLTLGLLLVTATLARRPLLAVIDRLQAMEETAPR
jgi:hypothetical protein